MFFNLNKTLALIAFGLIAISSFSLQITAMQENEVAAKIWTDEEFYSTDMHGYTILHDAVAYRHIRLFKRILQDERVLKIINFQTAKTGHTALHLAAIDNYEDLYRPLILAGADKTIINNDELTALSYIADENLRKELEELQPESSK